MNSPHGVGEEALSKRSPLSGDSVPWNGGVMVVAVGVGVVVESYDFFAKNIVEPRGPRRVALAWAPCTCSQLL